MTPAGGSERWAADLLHRLHSRGFQIDAAAGRLLVSPASRLTDQERADIRGHIRELLANIEGNQEWIAERAAILEFDAGMTRRQAEVTAAELFRRLQASG